jgi:hypothetical protein
MVGWSLSHVKAGKIIEMFKIKRVIEVKGRSLSLCEVVGKRSFMIRKKLVRRKKGIRKKGSRKKSRKTDGIIDKCRKE